MSICNKCFDRLDHRAVICKLLASNGDPTLMNGLLLQIQEKVATVL